MTDVKGRCPACGHTSLFLGSGGYVTCSIAECSNPGAVSDLLEEWAPPFSPDDLPKLPAHLLSELVCLVTYVGHNFTYNALTQQAGCKDCDWANKAPLKEAFAAHKEHQQDIRRAVLRVITHYQKELTA